MPFTDGNYNLKHKVMLNLINLLVALLTQMKRRRLKGIMVDNRPECQWTIELLGRVNKHFELDQYASSKLCIKF